MPQRRQIKDPKLIARETLRGHSFTHWQNLDNFEDTALDWLSAENLNAERRRNLLQRLARQQVVKGIVQAQNEVEAADARQRADVGDEERVGVLRELATGLADHLRGDVAREHGVSARQQRPSALPRSAGDVQRSAAAHP